MLGERSDQRGLWEADRLYLDHDVQPGDRGAPAHRGRDLEGCRRRVPSALHLWRLGGRFRRIVAAGALHPTVDGPPATASADDLLAYAAGSDCDDAAPLRQSRDVDIGQPISLETPDSKGEAERSPCARAEACGCYAQGYADALLLMQAPAPDTLLDQARRAATEVVLRTSTVGRQTLG